MILLSLILILSGAGVLSWLSEHWNKQLPRWISLIASTLTLALALILWGQHPGRVPLAQTSQWLVEWDREWIPQFGISLHFGMDGLSLLLVLLTAFLGILAVISSWKEIQERIGFFYFNLMWVLAGIIGVFLALDLFLFYFFWEMMLVPMYFLIALWGHENRVYASLKFFLFTQASGLLMLVAILGLYFVHGRSTGIYTFNYSHLLNTSMGSGTAFWLMLGFLIAFTVKLPAIPVHTWLPDAHTEAPTAGSIVLAGLLLKTGAYGLLRFVIPLFPGIAFHFAPVAMILAVIGILYGAILAFAQTDLKRLVAYTSISHMGFVLLGVFAWNSLALQGAVMQIICHGINTGTLFFLVGALQERIRTRDLGHMGGFWSIMPRMGGAMLFFALASLGLPGLGNFVGEFLVLTGSYQANVTLTALASIGFVFATIYSLRIMQRVFHGTKAEYPPLPDLSAREMAAAGIMIVALLWLGLNPQPILKTSGPALEKLQQGVAVTQQETAPSASDFTGSQAIPAKANDKEGRVPEPSVAPRRLP